MTDTTENSIDLRTVEALLNWQENGGLLEQTELDTFLELLSEARHNDDEAAPPVASGTARFIDIGFLGRGCFDLVVMMHPAFLELPQTTTVRTSEGELTFDGDITVSFWWTEWIDSVSENMTLDRVRQLSARAKHEEEADERHRRTQEEKAND